MVGSKIDKNLDEKFNLLQEVIKRREGALQDANTHASQIVQLVDDIAGNMAEIVKRLSSDNFQGEVGGEVVEKLGNLREMLDSLISNTTEQGQSVQITNQALYKQLSVSATSDGFKIVFQPFQDMNLERILAATSDKFTNRNSMQDDYPANLSGELVPKTVVIYKHLMDAQNMQGFAEEKRLELGSAADVNLAIPALLDIKKHDQDGPGLDAVDQELFKLYRSHSVCSNPPQDGFVTINNQGLLRTSINSALRSRSYLIAIDPSSKKPTYSGS